MPADLDRDLQDLLATSADHAHRNQQLDRLLDDAAADALVLGVASHVAWALCGADLRIQVSGERAWGFLVLQPGRRTVVTWAMDARRFAEEELPSGTAIEALRWDEGNPEDRALQLAGGGRVLSDCGSPGTDSALDLLRAAQYPLTDLELRRERWIAARFDAHCRAVADTLEPGMTEDDVAAGLTAAFLRDGLAVDEMMIGFDERIRRYRHPVARGARLERLAFVHPTVNRWGQHVIGTRMVSLGEIDAETAERFAAVSEIEALSVQSTRPGTAHRDVLASQQEAYRRLGYEDAWRDHWQGGQTGFALCEIAHVDRPAESIPERGLYNWFISLPGAKKEETTLATAEGGRILTLTGAWPTRTVVTELGPLEVADLLVR